MEKILPDGEEVLIFDSINSSIDLVDDKYIKGVIISSFESDDLSMHGSPWYEQIYSVLGEDKQIYTGTYGTPVIGRTFFRTVEDYKRYLKNKVESNSNVINVLEERNKKYLEIIEDFNQEKKQDEKKYTKTL